MIVSDSLEGTYCTAHSASALGFVDRVTASEDFLEESLNFVVSVLDGTEAVQTRTPPTVEDREESLTPGRNSGGVAALRPEGLILSAEAGTSTGLRNDKPMYSVTRRLQRGAIEDLRLARHRRRRPEEPSTSGHDSRRDAVSGDRRGGPHGPPNCIVVR